MVLLTGTFLKLEAELQAFPPPSGCQLSAVLSSNANANANALRSSQELFRLHAGFRGILRTPLRRRSRRVRGRDGGSRRLALAAARLWLLLVGGWGG